MKSSKLFLKALILGLGLNLSAHAISEINYKENYKKTVLPVEEALLGKEYVGMNNIKIHYAHYTTNPNSNQCVVIVPGKGEPLVKYAEVIQSLNTGFNKNKYQFFIIDHRGMGMSERILKKKAGDEFKTHVDFFENYILDLKILMDEVVMNSHCQSIYGLAHSMGGGIALGFEKEFPGYFTKLALISPMLKIQTGKIPYEAAFKIVAANVFLGKKAEYAPGEKTYEGEDKFEDNDQTTSLVRYQMMTGLSEKYPETRLGGVTNNWVYETMKFTDELRKNYFIFKLPMKVYTGQTEKYSDLGEMKSVCLNASNCTYLPTIASKHELLFEKDLVRTIVIANILDFFN